MCFIYFNTNALDFKYIIGSTRYYHLNHRNGEIPNNEISLDKALSASEFNAVDEVAISIDTIREKYRKVLQIVFDISLSLFHLHIFQCYLLVIVY